MRSSQTARSAASPSRRAGRVAMRARVYVDATETPSSRASPAARHASGTRPYPSTMFTMQHVDLAAALGALRELPQLLADHFASEGLPRKGGNLIPSGRPGEVLVALSRVARNDRAVDGSDADELSWAELEGRRQVVRLADFLKRRVPGFADAFVADSAFRLGVRETHKVVGEYTLAEDDVLGCRDFDDGIGRAAWPIEKHVAGGETLWRFLEPGTWYTIPYRCLVPRGIDNLLVAGRCLSADAMAFASARVIGPCMLAGQAVAVAAQQLRDRDVAARDADVDAIRHELAALGVPLWPRANRRYAAAVAAELRQIGDEIWVTERPLVVFGLLDIGTRMTVIRLADGGLFLHSPVPADAATRAAVDALGPVRCVVAPNYVRPSLRAALEAALPPGAAARRPGARRRSGRDLAFDAILGETPHPSYAASLDHVLLARRAVHERDRLLPPHEPHPAAHRRRLPSDARRRRAARASG